MSFDPTDLTDAEAFTVEQIAQGCVADLSDFERSPGVDRAPLRAAFLRHMMMGLGVGEAAPWTVRLSGVRVRGALIAGELDLADCTGAGVAGLPALALMDCDVPDPIDVSNAKLARLSVEGSRFSRINAQGVRIDGPLELMGAHPYGEGGDAMAWVDASQARIGGRVVADGATLKAPPPRPDATKIRAGARWYALKLSGADVRGDVELMAGFSAEGGVALDSADIGGDVWARGARLTRVEGDDGDALFAQNARIAGAMILDEGFAAEGGAWLLGIEIGGDLQCTNSAFVNSSSDGSKPAIDAGDAVIRGNVTFDGGFRAEGEVLLNGAAIDGTLKCDGGSFVNWTESGAGTAINAIAARIEDRVLLRQSFRAEGKVLFKGATIGGNFECDGGHFANPTPDGAGVALDVAGARIGGGVNLCAGFVAQGRVSLKGAAINGDFACGKGTFKNRTGDGEGVALTIEGARVDGSVLLRDTFRSEGVVRLYGARVDGDLELRDAACENSAPSSDVARLIVARNLTVRGALRLRAVTATEGVIDFTNASAGVLDDELADGWGGSKVRLRLGGFVYDHLESPDGYTRDRSIGRLRVEWLKRSGPKRSFDPQPYERLAKVLTQQGYSRAARRVYRHARGGVHRTQPRSPLGIAAGTIWGGLFGYGHAPLRATIVLAMVYGLGVAGAYHLDRRDLLVADTLVEARAIDAGYTQEPSENGLGAPPPSCRGRVNPALYALDVAVGPVNLGEEQKCALDRAAPGSWIYRTVHAIYALWMLLIVSLAVITVSGVMRRDFDG